LIKFDCSFELELGLNNKYPLTVRANLIKFGSHQNLGISDAENATRIGTGLFCPPDGEAGKIFGAFRRPLFIEN